MKLKMFKKKIINIFRAASFIPVSRLFKGEYLMFVISQIIETHVKHVL